MPSGGAAVAAAPAAGGAPAEAAEAKEEKEEEKVCGFMFSTLPLRLTFACAMYRKSPMMTWASVCSIRIKLCQCIFMSLTRCSTISSVSIRASCGKYNFRKLLALRMSTAFGAFISYHFLFALSWCVSEWHVVLISMTAYQFVFAVDFRQRGSPRV